MPGEKGQSEGPYEVFWGDLAINAAMVAPCREGKSLDRGSLHKETRKRLRGGVRS